MECKEGWPQLLQDREGDVHNQIKWVVDLTVVKGRAFFGASRKMGIMIFTRQIEFEKLLFKIYFKGIIKISLDFKS